MLVAIHTVLRMLDGFAILSVELADLSDLSIVGAVFCDELRGDRDRLLGVDFVIGSRTPELGVFAHETVGLQVASIFITDTFETIGAIVATVGSGASNVVLGASMHGEGSRDAVCLPQIDLSAASSILASSCVGVSLGWFPILHIGLAIDEFQIMWALSITVSGSILSTGSIELTLTSIFLHLNEVQSTIQTTSKLRIVDSEGELLVLEFQHLVVVIIFHQVCTRSNISAVGTLRHESKFETRATSLNAIGVGVLLICSLHNALRGASCLITARPSVASVAVGCGAFGVEPSPICINGHWR
jgi:hypothetical protein